MTDAKTDPARDVVTQSNRGKRAVLYLRVSDPSQVTTDYNPEGISIPAQREAGKRTADEMGAEIVNEFVEPGRTATTIDKRPVFQEMVAWVKAERDIDYIIVYHFNRVFRNAIDAGVAKRDLAKVGTRIISTVLNMKESPESQLIETIMHAVDQYQSEASGADIRYKMGQKARNGGTITRAKLGYVNVGEQFDGHEVRTVAVDPERGPLVSKLFELFATGQYSGQQVHKRITAAGLRTRGTKRYPGGQVISMSQVYNTLSDRYYLGVVDYRGIEYPGRHQALTTPATFDRVQRVLALRGGNGTRKRKHDHYLKGLIWCAACGRRYVIMRGKGNGGEYFYFFCRGRQDKVCSQPFIPVDEAERAVEGHYATVRLDADFHAALRRQLDELLKDELGSLSTLKKRLSARLKELDLREDHYLDLLGEPDWPQDKLKQKLVAIRHEREEISRQLDDAGGKLEIGRQFFLLALELMRDPKAYYERAAHYPAIRHAMNKVIFDRLYLGLEGVAAHDLAPGFADLVQLMPAPQIYERRDYTPPAMQIERPESRSVWKSETRDWFVEGTTPIPVQTGQGWSKADLVGVAGFEPATSSSRISGRL